MAMRGRAKTVSDSEIAEAYRRADEQRAVEPLAVGVHYDRTVDAVTIEMSIGAALVIPRHLLQGLQEATPEQLERGLLAAQGTALAWPELDADFTVASLLHGVYGGKRWMSELVVTPARRDRRKRPLRQEPTVLRAAVRARPPRRSASRRRSLRPSGAARPETPF